MNVLPKNVQNQTVFLFAKHLEDKKKYLKNSMSKNKMTFNF
jgi:hypothetical protein